MRPDLVVYGSGILTIEGQLEFSGGIDDGQTSFLIRLS